MSSRKYQMKQGHPKYVSTKGENVGNNKAVKKKEKYSSLY